MLLAELPANPVCGVPIDESVSRCNRAEFEVISPAAKFLIQTFNHCPGIHPFHISACLDTHRFGHAFYSLPRWTSGYIRPPDLGRITPTKSVPQKIKLTIRSQSAKLSLQVKVMNGTGQAVVSFEAAPFSGG
jgi:hypothetical protein